MTNANALADPKALSDVIRERLDAKITELMPDEVFDKMFEAAVRRMVTTPPKRYHHDPTPFAPLEQIIYDALSERLNQKVKGIFESGEWMKRFDAEAKKVDMGLAIEKAIEILDNASLRIVFVVNADSRLIGTVTDGDIRRGILRHLSLTKSVIHVMTAVVAFLAAISSVNYWRQSRLKQAENME